MTMNDLISRDEVLKILNNSRSIRARDGAGGVWIDLLDAIGEIERVPAAEPVRRAWWRAAKALGYKRIITYTLASEPGTSLRAAGWKCEGKSGGKRWTGKRSGRVPDWPEESKMRWAKMDGDEKNV